MEEEIWRPTDLYPNYEVSDGGHVRNKRTGRILHPFVDLLQNYPRVNLYASDGSRCHKMVHVLVMETFCGPKPKGYEIDHINCDRTDNRLENLRYVTPAEVTRIDSGLVVFKHNTFLSRRELKDSQEDATPSKENMRMMALAWELQGKKKK